MKYPQTEFRKAWDYLLFNQMHDILPGSSITPVYRDSAEDYAKMFGIVDGIEQQAMEVIAPQPTQTQRGDVHGLADLRLQHASFERDEGVVVPLPAGWESATVFSQTGSPS